MWTKYRNTLIRVSIFLAMYVATVALYPIIKKGMMIFLTMLALLVALFVHEMKENKDRGNIQANAIGRCYLFFIGIGACLPIPLILFGLSVDGPHRYTIIEATMSTLGGGLLGGLFGLLGMMIINQAYYLMQRAKRPHNKSL